MATWTDRYWNSAEGLRLHYRDYAGPRDKPPILCIPGLTRNARDFEPVADRYAGEWRVLTVDLRGRGESDHDPDPSHYSPAYYVADLLKLLDQVGIADAVFVGTSLGGICTMVLASTDADRIAGALLNDVGPEVGPVGIEHIATYVGQDVVFESWDAAAAELRERNGDLFPHWTGEDWERFTRRVAREDKDGIRFDYDMRIADNFQRARDMPPVDAWPSLRALAGRPVTILRGSLSQLLTQETADRMVAELDGDAELVVVPDVGHAPSLEEPESIAALDRLLQRVASAAS